MEIEAADQGDGSAAVGEERRFGCVRLLMQGFQDCGSVSEISPSRRSWRRRVGVLKPVSTHGLSSLLCLF